MKNDMYKLCYNLMSKLFNICNKSMNKEKPTKEIKKTRKRTIKKITNPGTI